MIGVCSLAALLAIFSSFDICISTKRKGSFVRQFISIITVSVPALWQSIIGKDDIVGFAEIWFKYFYVTYLLVLCVLFLVIYLFIFRYQVKKINKYIDSKTFTFFDLIINGYNAFRDEVEEEKKNQIEKKEKRHETIVELGDNLHDHLIQYINEIYLLVDEECKDIDGFIVYVLTKFINIFLGSADARFTLRRLDEKTNKMICILSTRTDKQPGDIDINKINLISKSMKLKRPVLYSRNIKDHQRTDSDSISNGIYDEYVSYCLLHTKDNKPYFSVSVDVKGRNVSRLQLLVDSAIFSIVCEAIKTKLIREGGA